MITNMEMKRRRSLGIRNRITNGGSGSSSNGTIGETDHGVCFRDWNDLVLVHIFSRLPARSLMRFKCVSKHWKSIITHDKCLIKLHEAHRSKGVTSFLVCPTWSRLVSRTPPCPLPGRVEIRSVMFSPEDLKFDGSSSLADDGDDSLFRSHNNVVLNARYNVLPPVNGLLCFINCDESDSFLIYNPCTGDKTPWISANDLFVSDSGQQEVAASPEKLRLENSYMFGFGYDPITRKHKVLCLYMITVSKRDFWPGFTCNFGENMVVRRKVMCGIFIVGELRWREIDSHQVPSRIASNKKSFYVNGCLCWVHYRSRQGSEVIVFDMGRETFRVISIPNCIPKNLYPSCSTGKLIDELVEVDGHLAILVEEDDDRLSLWIYLDNNGNNNGFNWIKEAIQMPCRWDELVNLDFKAITGTELAVVKFIKTRQKQCEWIMYYNRKERKYYRNKHKSLLDVTAAHTHAAHARYQITPFVETLLPVQTTQDGGEFN